MKAIPVVAGIFTSFALSWYGLTVLPQGQLSSLQPRVDQDTGEVYPLPMPGLAEQGRQVFVANGCVSCHSTQVRPAHAGSDIARDWGQRSTVALDYIYDAPALLGSERIGPDLTNVGLRQTDPAWHFRHLYNPRSVVPESKMPPFRFLFEKRKIVGERSAEAIALQGADAPPAGWEIVPKPEAKALVSYLLSLDRSKPIPQIPQVPQEAAAK